MPFCKEGGVNIALFKSCPLRNHLIVGAGLPPLDEQVKVITEFSTSVDDDELMVISGGPGGTEKDNKICFIKK